MFYNDFQGLKLSALGLGTMRLPVTDGDNSKIDMAATAEMVDYAIKNGINYFDTAWGYHGGNSEIAIGKVLSPYPRESYYLTSKFPGFVTSNFEKKEEIFAKQLEKCEKDYFDFYLFHNVCEQNIEEYLNEKYGLREWFLSLKRDGKIRHIGFSVHGDYEVTRRFLDMYGDICEFCQIQLNWFDYSFQDAKSKIDLLRERNIPFFVMEPLRGGSLVNLAPKNKERLAGVHPEMSIPEWSFRYLETFDDCIVTLSGMSNLTQLKENIATFEKKAPLTEGDVDILYELADAITKENNVPCTACRYCTEKCPMGLDIPNLISLYNEYTYTGGGFLAPMRISSLPEEKRPSACLGCRACEEVCPQCIKISEVLAAFSEKLSKKK